jgi:hypothetical protein
VKSEKFQREIVPSPPVFARSVASGAKVMSPSAPTVAITFPSAPPSLARCTRNDIPNARCRTPTRPPSIE